MKKIFLAFTIALMATQLPAQNHKLLITDLMAANQTANLNVETASFKSELINPNGNPSPNNTTYKYYFIRRMDNRSDKIATGARTGRVYPQVQVWTKDHSGKIEKYRLQNALISLYSEHYENGKPPTESFVITYQNRTKM